MHKWQLSKSSEMRLVKFRFMILDLFLMKLNSLKNGMLKENL